MRTYYHYESMKKAFLKHLSPTAIDHVFRYNFGVDIYGVIGWKILEKKVFPLIPLANYWYSRRDHVDQMDSRGALDCWRSHVESIMEVADDNAYPLGDLEKMFRILGRATHAMADFFSHSNVVALLYDYYRDNEKARRAVEESGLDLPEYLVRQGPTLTQLLEAPEYESFREKSLPRLFTFQSIPDTGPTCHEECSLDWPDGPGSQQKDYPRAFDVAYRLAEVEQTMIIDKLFKKLKNENPEKFESLTNALRDSPLKPDEHGPAVRRARWWSDRFAVWD